MMCARVCLPVCPDLCRPYLHLPHSICLSLSVRVWSACVSLGVCLSVPPSLSPYLSLQLPSSVTLFCLCPSFPVSLDLSQLVPVSLSFVIQACVMIFMASGTFAFRSPYFLREKY